MFAAVVQPTVDGGLLVGRTSAAGWVQIPGGVAEPPADVVGEVDEVWLARVSRRESWWKRQGVYVSPGDLSFSWSLALLVAMSGYFRVSALPEKDIRDRFATLQTVERAVGRLPELDNVMAVGSIYDLIDLSGPYADSSILVVRRYLESVSQLR